MEGVSMRKVTSIAEQLCGLEGRKSQASAPAWRLDAEIVRRLGRPGNPYPCSVVDAHYEKARQCGAIASHSLLIGRACRGVFGDRSAAGGASPAHPNGQHDQAPKSGGETAHRRGVSPSHPLRVFAAGLASADGGQAGGDGTQISAHGRGSVGFQIVGSRCRRLMAGFASGYALRSARRQLTSTHNPEEDDSTELLGLRSSAGSPLPDPGRFSVHTLPGLVSCDGFSQGKSYAVV